MGPPASYRSPTILAVQGQAESGFTEACFQRGGHISGDVEPVDPILPDRDRQLAEGVTMPPAFQRLATGGEFRVVVRRYQAIGQAVGWIGRVWTVANPTRCALSKVGIAILGDSLM